MISATIGLLVLAVLQIRDLIKNHAGEWEDMD